MKPPPAPVETVAAPGRWRVLRQLLFTTRLRHFGARLALALLAFVAVWAAASGQWRVALFERLELVAYDLRLRATLPGGVDERIVIVDIDEASLRAEGQWPWPRARLAEMVDVLFDHYGIGLLGMDVTFPEPERQTGAQLLTEMEPALTAAQRAELARLRAAASGDARLAHSLRDRPVVLGAFFDPAAAGGPGGTVLGDPGLPWLPRDALADGVAEPVRASGYIGNLGMLSEAARSGFFNSPLVDEDGVYRRVPLLVEWQGGLYPSLVLAMLAELYGSTEIEPVFGAGYGGAHDLRVEALRLAGAVDVPVDLNLALHVPYRARQGGFPYFSAAAVLRGEVAPERLAGAIVLVGTSAAGLVDLRPAPMQAVFPGVEINANALAALLDGSFKRRPAYLYGTETLQLGVLALLGFLLGRLPVFTGLVVTLGLAATVVAGNLWLWHQGWIVQLGYPLLLLMLHFLLNTVYGFAVETRRGRHLSRQFGQYVPPQLVREMEQSGERFGLSGEEREMTVLFSDVAGFTSVSEGMSPNELTQMMQALLTPLTEVIHEQRGTIDKYIGDAVMAFWGAPLTDPEHARHAVLAALAMQQRMAELRPRFAERGWPELHIRIGLNTGRMRVGNMGSSFRMAYTVLGDAVNLGSRLEGVAKRYGVGIVVSDATREVVNGVIWRELDRVQVKGRNEPTALFEPVGQVGAVNERALARVSRHHTALAALRARDFAGAARSWSGLLAEGEDALYQYWWRRAEHLRLAPPPADWNGVTRLDEK